jgi:hypothetical protein
VRRPKSGGRKRDPSNWRNGHGRQTYVVAFSGKRICAERISLERIYVVRSSRAPTCGAPTVKFTRTHCLMRWSHVHRRIYGEPTSGEPACAVLTWRARTSAEPSSGARFDAATYDHRTRWPGQSAPGMQRRWRRSARERLLKRYRVVIAATTLRRGDGDYVFAMPVLVRR